MKKISVLFAALLTLSFVFVGGGCSDDDDDDDDLLGPANVWCSMELAYNKNADGTTETTTENQAKVKATFFYTDTEITTGLKEGLTLPAGITVLLTPADSGSESVISGLKDKAYVLKSFPKDEDTVLDDDAAASSSKFKGTRTKWTVLYYAKSELRAAANQKTTIPPQIAASTASEYVTLTDLGDFSWKSLLRSALNTLLAE